MYTWKQWLYMLYIQLLKVKMNFEKQLLKTTVKDKKNYLIITV